MKKYIVQTIVILLYLTNDIKAQSINFTLTNTSYINWCGVAINSASQKMMEGVIANKIKIYDDNQCVHLLDSVNKEELMTIKVEKKKFMIDNREGYYIYRYRKDDVHEIVNDKKNGILSITLLESFYESKVSQPFYIKWNDLKNYLKTEDFFVLKFYFENYNNDYIVPKWTSYLNDSPFKSMINKIHQAVTSLKMVPVYINDSLDRLMLREDLEKRYHVWIRHQVIVDPKDPYNLKDSSTEMYITTPDSIDKLALNINLLLNDDYSFALKSVASVMVGNSNDGWGELKHYQPIGFITMKDIEQVVTTDEYMLLKFLVKFDIFIKLHQK